jgi:4,5:9,10-diseco-3-hydroxy-5,9,17-trioxoandrosta-1(10),2-diene-4-oate hydrolase
MAAYRDEELLAHHAYDLGESYVEVNGVTLCYQDMGEGPAVLIVPGLGTSVDFWQLNVPVLAQEHRVLAVDMPGSGKSDKPDVDYNLYWLSEMLVAFLDARQVDRTSLIGGSLGGHVALLTALEHTERVDKLVMMGSTGDWPPPSPLMDLGFRLFWNDWIVADHIRRNWPNIFPHLFMRETDLTRRLFAYQMAVRADGRRFAAEGRASSRALKSIFYRSCQDRLDEVPVPVLLIWGVNDDIHLLANACYMRKHMPDSRLVVVQDSAHEVMIDQPDVFNETVMRFLAEGTAGIEDVHDCANQPEPKGW